MTSAVLDLLSGAALRVLGRAGAVLCYHGFTTPTLSAAGTLHIPSATFRETLDALGGVYTIIPLSELVERRHMDRSTSGLIALTFDDAYASILTVADTLAATQTPITVFPVGDSLARPRAFWWDRVDDLFAWTPAERWRVFEERCGLPEAYRKGQPLAFGPLRPFRQWTLAEFRGRWPDHLTPLLDELERELGRATSQRPMTETELAELARRVPLELGVHTVSHPVLPLLPDDELRQEIADGYRAVRDRWSAAVPILAAPFGLGDARVVAQAAAAGMRSTLSLGGTTIQRHSSVEWLPRICLSSGLPGWKLKLQLTGRFDRHAASPTFPDLPSATT